MKVTDTEGSVSWVVIEGTINGTSYEVYMNGFDCAIDCRTKGFINLGKYGLRVVEREPLPSDQNRVSRKNTGKSGIIISRNRHKVLKNQDKMLFNFSSNLEKRKLIAIVKKSKKDAPSTVNTSITKLKQCLQSAEHCFSSTKQLL